MDVDKGGSTGDTRNSDLVDGLEVENGKGSSTESFGLQKEKGGCSSALLSLKI